MSLISVPHPAARRRSSPPPARASRRSTARRGGDGPPIRAESSRRLGRVPAAGGGSGHSAEPPFGFRRHRGLLRHPPRPHRLNNRRGRGAALRPNPFPVTKRHAASNTDRAVDPLGRFRAARRGSARGHRCRSRLHPYRRHGRAFRAQPHHRAGRGEGAPAALDAALRRASDDLAGRSVRAGLRRRRRRHHHRPSRGRAAPAPHAAANQVARQEGRRVAQSGNAARGRRQRPRRRRSGAGDERQSRLRRAELHHVAARQDPRAAPAHRRDGPRHRPRSRRPHKPPDRAHRHRRRSPCPPRGHGHLQWRRFRLCRQHQTHARRRRGTQRRLMRLSRSLLYGSAPYHLSLLGRAPAALALRLDQPWPGDPARGAALLAGAFSFAGETAQAAMPPWTAPMPTQWLAGLHGFSWLADLAATGEATAAQAARRWTADWLVRCDAWDAIAWRADVTGDRLFAWIEHMDTLAGGAEEAAARKRLVASIARQARHLARVAAREAMGVKRLAALRGLVAAVAALGGERRLERVLARLAREIVAQILPDGGHAARSPAAQLAALRYLVDARAALRARQVEVPAALQSAIDRAAPMLRFFRHGDGTLALFNGADEGETALTDRVLARADAKGRPPPSAPYAGFQRAQAGRTLVLADTGVPARPGFDGDAHAGTLSFEMSHGRERLVVNCGGYQRTSSDWRHGARAPAPPSTLIVPDTKSSGIRAHGWLRALPPALPLERIHA